MGKVIAAALGLVLLAAAAGADDATAVTLQRGEVLDLCRAGLATCPAGGFTCDDPKVAVIENGGTGAVLRGLSSGTTVCNVMGNGLGLRRVLRVTVRPSTKPR